jgi:hypothetical protein
MVRTGTSIARSNPGLLANRSVVIAAADGAALVDYTTVSIGWRIVGHLVDGHRTTFSLRCPNCSRVGRLSNGKR